MIRHRSMLETANINRRRFFRRLGLAGAASLLLGAADAKYLEPHWLKIRRMRIGAGAPVCRFAYFTDLHYKGDRAFAESVVAAGSFVLEWEVAEAEA